MGMLEKAPTEHVGNFAAESFLLGRATAEVHLALARSLPVTVLGRAEIESLADAMALRLDAAASAVPQLAPYQTGLRRIFRELAASARAGATLRVQRIHGDLHLGQVMRTARGWVLLDFEGEPAKPLSERRLPSPRSATSPACSAPSTTRRPIWVPPLPEVATAASAWAARNRAAYCAGYAAAGAEDPLADPLLLRALETDKAVYEVLYEARHRPEWLPIPLSAISRLATDPAPPQRPRRRRAVHPGPRRGAGHPRRYRRCARPRGAPGRRGAGSGTATRRRSRGPCSRHRAAVPRAERPHRS
ncbi:phosphotransferase [Streptacidiphilus monticola]